MKARKQSRRSAFTLIELIGVLAILAILASVVVPNVIRSLDQAAEQAEAQTLANLGGQIRLYLKRNGVPPPADGTWSTALGAFSDLGPAAIAANARGVNRVYLLDPAANPAPRALILSSLRPTLGLPDAASISSASQFDALWQTPDGTVPPAGSWSGWNAWNAVSGSGQYLVVGRVNLQYVYDTDLQALTLTLNYVPLTGGSGGNSGSGGSGGGNNGDGNGNGNGNGWGWWFNWFGGGGSGGGSGSGGGGGSGGAGSAAASYNIVLANGTVQPLVNLNSGGWPAVLTLHPGDRLNLYSLLNGQSLDYSYVASSSPKTFDFDGTNWTPQ